MTEAELQAAVIDLCRYRRLWTYHTHNSRRSNPGWPDLVILGKLALFVELKSERGNRTRAQTLVADRLEEACLRYRLWRPADLTSGRIIAELDAIR